MTNYSLDNGKNINIALFPSYKVTPAFLVVLLLLACQLTPIAWLAASRVLLPSLPAAPHLQKKKNTNIHLYRYEIPQRQYEVTTQGYVLYNSIFITRPIYSYLWLSGWTLGDI